MNDYEIIWKRDYDIADLGLSKKAGGRAFLSQHEANLSEAFRKAKNEGAIEVRQVVRSMMRTPMAHMEPPFVGLSRPKRETPTEPVVAAAIPTNFTQDDLVRCIQMGVSLALEGFSELLDAKLEAFQAKPPRAPRESVSPRVARAPREPQEPALPEPGMPLPSINFHAGKRGNSATEEFGESGQLTSASEKLRAMRKAAQ